MLHWIIYDITSNKDRTKIAKTCQEFGLIRVQYSVFFGDIPTNKADEIAEISKELIDPITDAVFILPISEDNFNKKIIVGHSFDEDFATNKKLTTFI